MKRSAVFSSDRNYRYELRRRWGVGRPVLFVGVNPSTAGESEDDPTVRRMIGFARLWGRQAITVANLYALVSTDPKKMLEHPSPIGPLNDQSLCELVREAGLVVACWGLAAALRRDRMRDVLRLLTAQRDVYCLGRTGGKFAEPRHPLRLAYSTPLLLLARTGADL
jgi:hypothetical protein